MVAKKRLSPATLLIECAMIFLALVSGFLLLLELTTSLSVDQIQLFDRIDLVIAIVFLSEFVIRTYAAKKHLAYFKHHSWELLAAIPLTTPLTQALRLVRLLRLIHLIQSVSE